VQARGRVVRQDRHLPLRDDFAAVYAGVDKVDGTPSHLFTCGKGLRPCFTPRKLRQKRGMQIDDAARKRVQRDWLQNPHEAGENNQLHSSSVQQPNELLLDLWLKLRSELSRRKVGMGNTELARNLENAGIGHIRNDDPDVCRQVTGVDLLEDRPTI